MTPSSLAQCMSRGPSPTRIVSLGLVCRAFSVASRCWVLGLTYLTLFLGVTALKNFDMLNLFNMYLVDLSLFIVHKPILRPIFFRASSVSTTPERSSVVLAASSSYFSAMADTWLRTLLMVLVGFRLFLRNISVFRSMSKMLSLVASTEAGRPVLIR